MMGRRRRRKPDKWQRRNEYRKQRWREFREEVLSKHGYKCVHCGATGELHLHHIVPLGDGGVCYDPTNVEPCCRSCHLEQHKILEYERLQPWERALRNLVDSPIPTTEERYHDEQTEVRDSPVGD